MLGAFRFQQCRNNLVGNWRFSRGPTGNVLINSRRGISGALINGPIWSARGSEGYSLFFDGIDDYVQIAIPQITYPFTLSFWSIGHTTGVGVGMFNDSTANWMGWYLNGPSQNFTSANNNAFGTSIVRPNVNSSVWQQVTLAAKSSAEAVAYTNGIGVAGTFSQTPTGVNRISIGASARGGPADNFSNGRFDDLSLFNRALTDGEILELFRYGRGALDQRVNVPVVRGYDPGGVGTTYSLDNVDSRSQPASAADALSLNLSLTNTDTRTITASAVDALSLRAGLGNTDTRSITVSAADVLGARLALGNVDSKLVTVSHASDVTLVTSGSTYSLDNVDSRSVTASAVDAVSIRATLTNADSRCVVVSDSVAMSLRAGLGNRDTRIDTRSAGDLISVLATLANRDTRVNTLSATSDVTLVGAEVASVPLSIWEYSTLESA
jgi:hypothetical protein